MAAESEHEEVLGMDEKKTDPWWEDVFQGAGQQVCEGPSKIQWLVLW